MSEKTCDICCEKFNKSNHKPCNCQYCNKAVCVDCNQKYLESTTKDAHCMNCNKAWNYEVLTSFFTKKYLTGDYKKQRENILYDREKSLLPATQEYAENLKKQKEIALEQTKLLDKQRRLVKMKANIYERYRRATTNEARLKIREEEMNICIGISEVKYTKLFLTYKRYLVNTETSSNRTETERRKFIKACPKNGCNGFLSTAWKCGLCNTKVCAKCHEIKSTDEDADDNEAEEETDDNASESGSETSENETENKKHKCKPENIETAKLIKSECKACPACASMIFKINGCDQMWCTSCNTAFSWNTGRIETNNIHNPHYYEYLRRTNNGVIPRNPGDNPCGGGNEVTTREVHNYCQALVTNYQRLLINSDFSNADDLQRVTGQIYAIQRIKEHMRAIEIPRFNTDVIRDNRDLRANFLLGEITEDQFKKTLQMNEKARNKKNEIRMIIEMFVATTNDILLALFQTNRKVDIMNKITEMNNLKDYFNDSMKPISKRYTCVVPNITDNWFSTTTKF